jgi:hypothetical protein
MTVGGWITMILSVGFVTALFGWCIYRVLRGSPADAERLAHVEPVTEEETAER